MSQRIYNFSLLTARFLSSTMDFPFELYFVVLHPFTNSSSWILPPRSTLFYGFIVPSLCRVERNPLKKRIEKGYSVQKNITARQELWYRLYCYWQFTPIDLKQWLRWRMFFLCPTDQRKSFTIAQSCTETLRFLR